MSLKKMILFILFYDTTIIKIILASANISLSDQNRLNIENLLIGLRWSPPHTAREFWNDLIHFDDNVSFINQKLQQEKFIKYQQKYYNTGKHYHQFLFGNELKNISISTKAVESFPKNNNINKFRKQILVLDDIQPSANCEPELRTIKLNLENDSVPISSIANRNVVGNRDLYFPHCIRVPRCGGCCPSERLNCVPKSLTWHNISIMHVQYSSLERRFRYSGIRQVQVEKHHKCGCECIQKPTDCQPWQSYRSDECRCVCLLRDRIECIKRQQQFSSTVTSTKTKNTLIRIQQQHQQRQPQFLFWNETDCKCQCRAPEIVLKFHNKKDFNYKCLNGSTFNYISCRCEPQLINNIIDSDKQEIGLIKETTKLEAVRPKIGIKNNMEQITNGRHIARTKFLHLFFPEATKTTITKQTKNNKIKKIIKSD